MEKLRMKFPLFSPYHDFLTWGYMFQDQTEKIKIISSQIREKTYKNCCIFLDFICFSLFLFVFKPHPAVFRDFAWLCSQGLHLAGLRGSYEILVIEPLSTACKTNMLPAVLSLWSHKNLFLYSQRSGVTLEILMQIGSILLLLIFSQCVPGIKK